MSAKVAEEPTSNSHLALVTGDALAPDKARRRVGLHADPYWTPVVIRPAVSADATALLRLAHLDSARPLRGAAIIAEQIGVPIAAIDLDDDRAIADPFRAGADLVELLRLRARQLRTGGSTTKSPARLG